MNQIAKIQDKIKGEIETAEKNWGKTKKQERWFYWDGKVQALQDLQQWIKDNIEEA